MAPLLAETDLERALLADAELRRGLAWGAPRFGHPEGRVGEHVAHLLGAIAPDSPLRAELRLVALLHDSFKHLVRRGPAYSPDADHAVLARRFAERFIDDERVLATIELHDEPYWLWHNQGGDSDALTALLRRVPDRELFLAFVELDASTEGKDPSLLFWLRYTLAARGLWTAGRHAALPPPAAAGDELTTHQTVYVQTMATRPESQPAVAEAIADVVAANPALARAVEVLAAVDGTRITLVTRW